MLRKFLVLIAILIPVSVGLYLLHSLLAPFYARSVLELYRFFVQGTGRSAHAIYDSSFRLIPLLSLLLVTPRLPLRRRLAFIGLSVLVFFLLDLTGMLFWDGPPPPSYSAATSSQHILFSLIWDLLGHWILPFILWLIAACRVLPSLVRSPRLAS